MHGIRERRVPRGVGGACELHRWTLRSAIWACERLQGTKTCVVSTVVRVAILSPLAVPTAGCTKETPAPSHPVVGTWIRIFPSQGAPDTLRLLEDGSVLGSTAGLDPMPFRLIRWKIGDRLMPGGFCIGEGELAPDRRLWNCQGFAVIEDTLMLANQRRTVLLRARVEGRSGDGAQKARPSRAVAPAPGDSARQ